MKYIKSYKIFESSYDELLEDIRDLLVDLEDQDFSVNVFKRRVDYSTTNEDIFVSIYKERKPNPASDLSRFNDLFKYSDVSFYVESLVNFMKYYNYSLRNDLNELQVQTRFIINPNDFSQVFRTSLKLNFKNNK
jgi:hypothetical protein